jgi:antitoxin component of RelBE/YafQ-DinJ toxin-antitoxin module
MKRDSRIHVRISSQLKKKLQDSTKNTVLTVSDIVNLILEEWVNDGSRANRVGKTIKDSFRKS